MVWSDLLFIHKEAYDKDAPSPFIYFLYVLMFCLLYCVELQKEN